MKSINKFIGAIIGSALGDAIGQMAFLLPEREALIDAIDKAQELIYTDDTAMSIALMEVVIEEGEVDCEKIGRNFSIHYKKEPWRGYASGPPTIFKMVENEGISYREASKRIYGGQGSYGNGAAMRIAPIGVYFHDSPDLYDIVRESAICTHSHPIGIDGAAVQAKAISIAFELDPNRGFSEMEFLNKIIEFSRTDEMKERLNLIGKALNERWDDKEALRAFGGGVSVLESLPFSLFCFLRYGNSFERCLWCSVLNGGDRDTMGAMACAISGAYVGIKNIRDDWKIKLENYSRIQELIMKLWHMNR